MVTLIVNNHVLKGIELVIFDKDGTLIDVHTYWANMVRLRANLVAERLGMGSEDKPGIQAGIMDAMGVLAGKMCIKPEGPVGLKKREIVLQAGVKYLISQGYSDQTDLFIDVFRTVDELSVNHLNEIIRPLEGLFPLMKKLKKSGCKTAVATTDRTDRAGLAMNQLGLLDDFDVIVGADMVSRPKPDPEIIDTICHVVSVPVEKSVMVGDSAADVKTGLNAGCLASIGVESGLTPAEQLRALTPYVTKDISKINVTS